MPQKLTCLTCRVSLIAVDARDHYKTEWHIYNLKRKLTQLAPLTEPEYALVLARHCSAGTSTKSSNGDSECDPPKSCYCETCGKIFQNTKAYQQHNSSKRHSQMTLMRQRHGSAKRGIIEKDKITSSESIESKQEGKSLMSIAEEEQKKEKEEKAKRTKEVEEIIDGDADDFNESDWEEVSEEEEEDEEELEGIPLNECLFCSAASADMKSNMAHMSRVHCFFLPDLEYCVDIRGMLRYLGVKIASGNCCLYCSDYGKQFASKKATQQHMLDKGHTKIKFDSHGHGREPHGFIEFEDFYDYSPSYPSKAKDDDVENEDHDHDHEDDEEEVDPELLDLDGSDYQLKLPTGSVIGHRSLLVYYRQRLKPIPAEKRGKNRQLLGDLMSQYRALGWTGMTTKAAAVRRAKDIAKWHRVRQRAALNIGRKHNLSLQPHLRCQLGFN